MDSVSTGQASPARAAGLADPAADERPWRYAPVECGRCGAVVEVAKFSLQHTSLQWSAQAVLRCAEFCAAAAGGRPSALIATCASLRASIDAAVSAGRVEILPP
jgi:hypothetical protein